MACCLALLLSLQAVAAVAMPSCARGGDLSQAGAHAALATDADHAHHASPPPSDLSGNAPGHASHGPACDQCGLCNLACAPALPARVQALPAIDVAPGAGTPPHGHLAHVPAILLRPPLGLAV